MIGKLSEQNAVLDRQLQELRMENERLRAAADKLRGKMVAKKMVKQWMERHQQQQQPPASAFQRCPPQQQNPSSHPSDDEDDDDFDLDLDDLE